MHAQGRVGKGKGGGFQWALVGVRERGNVWTVLARNESKRD